jgi:hypothetical protein
MNRVEMRTEDLEAQPSFLEARKLAHWLRQQQTSGKASFVPVGHTMAYTW